MGLFIKRADLPAISLSPGRFWPQVAISPNKAILPQLRSNVVPVRVVGSDASAARSHLNKEKKKKQPS